MRAMFDHFFSDDISQHRLAIQLRGPSGVLLPCEPAWAACYAVSFHQAGRRI